MMSRLVSRIIVFIALLIYSTGSSESNLGVGEPKIRCKEVERQALLMIKDDLYNSAVGTFPSSWENDEAKSECCEWSGGSWLYSCILGRLFDTYLQPIMKLQILQVVEQCRRLALHNCSGAQGQTSEDHQKLIGALASLQVKTTFYAVMIGELVCSE